MPFAPIDNARVQFFYLDSGVPILKDEPYTTLVVVHGFGWNSYIFSRLLPLAAASHVRLVLLSRRGYSGSTPFTKEEISGIDPAVTTEHDDSSVGTSRANGQLFRRFSTFMGQRAAEMAHFLAWFIDNAQIPPRSNSKDGASGGISLLGWSLGNTTSLSLLAFASTLDPALMKKLEGYLRKLVIFDPPNHALGYRQPKNTYNPLFDLNIPAAERQPTFRSWTTSYFNHSQPTLDPVSSYDLMNGLQQKTPDPSRQSTLSHLSPGDFEAGLENVTPAHGDPFSLAEHARQVHEDVRLRAIFGDLNGTSAHVPLPNVEISYICCTQSVWETVLAARTLKAEMASPPGPSARPVSFFELKGNHYVHWDHPLRTFATFAAAIE